jgi:arginine repressor
LGIVQEIRKTMAKTKIRGEGSKAIRYYLSKHPTAPAQEVVDGLKADGVTVTAGLVYSVKAYSAKKKAGKKTAKATKSTPSTNGASSTKADRIREVAKGMAKPVRPRDVQAVLATQGIRASSPQISRVLKSMGRKRRRKAAAGGATRALTSSSTEISIDDLVAAKKLVGQVGSIEKVRGALAALARLG